MNRQEVHSGAFEIVVTLSKLFRLVATGELPRSALALAGKVAPTRYVEDRDPRDRDHAWLTGCR